MRRFVAYLNGANGRVPRLSLLSSAVSFGAMPDAEDPHGVVVEREQDAVVAEAEADRSGHIALAAL